MAYSITIVHNEKEPETGISENVWYDEKLQFEGASPILIYRYN